MLSEVCLHLESRIRELGGQKQVIRLDHAFSAFSGDIIRLICLGADGTEDRFLSDPHFSSEWCVPFFFFLVLQGYSDLVIRYDMLQMIIRSIPLFTGFPWIIQ